mgnify:CR=1 FL=1
MSTCQKKTGSVVSLESMGSTSAMSQIMTCQELKYNGKPIYFIKPSVLIFSAPNISLAVGKEKASAMDADLFAKSKGQTQICIFNAQIYSFLFRHPEKRF